ncbi:MAG: hypothetical protein IJC16_07300 [Rikenellaceae bacterium]|nr:hypothetical protein [Rikenellaceae bacterium]
MELLIVILLIGFSIFQALSKAQKKESNQQPHPGDIFFPHGDDPWADLAQPAEPEPIRPAPAPAATPHTSKPAQTPAPVPRTTPSRNASHKTVPDHTQPTAGHIMDDFDPAKAIIYAEIMSPKFKEYSNCIDD